MAVPPVESTRRLALLHGWRQLERALTAMGLVAALIAMVCLLAFGLGWSPASDFLRVWLVLAVGASPLGLWIHRAIKPLF